MALPLRQALAIGNNAYRAGGSPLSSCVNDARDMSLALRSIGFHVMTKTDVESASMRTVTQQFIRSIQPGAIVIFYFSGHGVQYDGYNFLVPLTDVPMSSANIKQNAISPEKLIEDIHTRNPRVVIVILDSCRAYWGPGSLLRERPWKKPLGMKLGLAPMRVPPATIVAYACGAEDISTQASINGKNSLYTYHLLRHITTPNVDIEHVLRRVAVDVENDPKNNFGDQTPYRQIPYRYSSCNEYICLVPIPGKNLPIRPKRMRSGANSSPLKNPLPKMHSNRHFQPPIAYHPNPFNYQRYKPTHHHSSSMHDPSRVMRYPTGVQHPLMRPLYYR